MTNIKWKREAVVVPRLDEVSYGFDVLCYEGGEFVKKVPYADKDDAKIAADRWVSGENRL